MNWPEIHGGALVGNTGLLPFVMQSGVNDISSTAMSPW